MVYISTEDTKLENDTLGDFKLNGSKNYNDAVLDSRLGDTMIEDVSLGDTLSGDSLEDHKSV